MSSPRVQYRGDPPTESVDNSKVEDQNQERHDQVDESQQQRNPNHHQQQHYHFHPQHAQQQLMQQDQQQQQHHQQQHHQQQHHHQQHQLQHQSQQLQQHDSNAQGYNNQSGSQYNVGPRAQCLSQHNGYSNPQSHPYDNRGRSNNGTPRIMAYNPSRQPQQYSNTSQAGYSDGNGSANNVNNFNQVNGSSSTHVTTEREGRGMGRFGAQGPTCSSEKLGDQSVLQPPQAKSHMNTQQAPMHNQGFNNNNQNTGQDMQGRSYGPSQANSGAPSSTSASSRGSYNVASGNNGQMRHSNTHSQHNYQCQQPQSISQEDAESQQQRHTQQAGTGALVRENKHMRNISSPMNEQRVLSDSITPEQNQGFDNSQGPGDIKYAHSQRAQPQLAIAAEAASVPQQQSQPPGSRGTEAEDTSQNGSVSGRRRVSGYRLKTSVPSITTSQLPHHWRCNKALAVPFVVYSSEPIPDGTEVQVVAITSDGNQGELRNSNAYFRANVANFSGFRFVGRSGRGKAFRLILKFQTHPPMEAVLELKVKITVDGPRPKRARRLSEPSKAAEAEAWKAKELEKAKNVSEEKVDAAAAGQAEDGHADTKSHHTGSHHTGSIHGNNVGGVYTNSPAKKMRPGTPNASRVGYPSKPGNSRNNTNIRSNGDPATAYENGMVNSGTNANPGPHVVYAQNSNNPSHHSHAPSFDGNSQSNGSLRSQHSQPAGNDQLLYYQNTIHRNKFGSLLYERDQNRQDSSHGGSHGPQQTVGSAASCSSYAILQGLKLVSLSVTNGLEGDPITAVIKISESIVQQFGWSNMSYSVAFGQHPPVFTNPIVNNNGQMFYRFHAPAIQSKMTQLTALVKVANKQIYCGENVLMFEQRSNATPLPRKYGTVDSRGLGTEMLKLHAEFSEIMEQRQPGSNASPGEVAFLSKLCFEEDVMLQKFRESIMILGQMRFLPPVGGSPDTSMTALHLAAEFGWQNFMGVLLDAGADLDQRDAMDFTAASYAYKAGQRALLEYLKSRDGYNHNFYKPQSQYRPPLEYQKQQQQLLQQQLEYEQQQQARTNIQQRQTNEQQQQITTQQTMTQEMQQQRQLEQQQMQRQLDAQQQQQEQQLMALQQQQQRLNTQQEMQQKQQQQNDQVDQQNQQWEQQQRMVPRGAGGFKPYEPDQPQQLQIGSSQQQQDQGQQQGLGPGQFQSHGVQQQMRSLDRLPSKGCQQHCQHSFDPGRQSQFDSNGQQQFDNNGQPQFDNNGQPQFDNNGQQQFDNNGQQGFGSRSRRQLNIGNQQQSDNRNQQQFNNRGQQQFNNRDQHQQQFDYAGQQQTPSVQQSFDSRSRPQYDSNSGLQPGQVTHLNQGGRACTTQRSNRASSDSCYSGYQVQKRPRVSGSAESPQHQQYVSKNMNRIQKGGSIQSSSNSHNSEAGLQSADTVQNYQNQNQNQNQRQHLQHYQQQYQQQNQLQQQGPNSQDSEENIQLET